MNKRFSLLWSGKIIPFFDQCSYGYFCGQLTFYQRFDAIISVKNYSLFLQRIETFPFDLKEHSQEMEIQTGNRFKISSIKYFKTPCEKVLQSFLATFFFPHKKRLQHVAVTIYSIKKFVQNENEPWFLPNSISSSTFEQNLVLAELVCREIKEIALLTVDVADYYVPCVNEFQFE